ncbi:hypothetical protein [Nitrosomonas sp.]|uniref:hypothetical protein n=1 Tax=Nitrosomonas sp. TaxID=42353 RepID=UPI0028401D06|nr:hypothetical protein [Nitrosomonas sp.]MDR4513600.1 hypothetical protein [Nitrosomonas sp.]
MNNSADDDTKPDMPEVPVVEATAANSDIADTAETSLNDREMNRQVIAQKLIDTQTPGFQAEFDPDEAELLGAFKEDALSEVEALNSSIDQSESTDGGQ